MERRPSIFDPTVKQVKKYLREVGAKDGQKVEYYDADSGERYHLIRTYQQDGIVCVDLSRRKPELR